MLVRQLMTPEPYTVEVDTTLGEALIMMYRHDIHELPVLRGVMLEGILTERDLRSALGPAVKDRAFEEIDEAALDALVSAVMSDRVIAVKEDTDISDAVRLLLEHRVGSLPVVDHNLALVGIISVSDVLAYTLELLD